MNFRNIGPRIKWFRETRGLTQEELAGRAGVSQSYIARVELSKTSPSLKRLEKIADALGVEIKDLMEGGC